MSDTHERSRPLILVADDEADISELVRIHLEKLDCEVMIAATGADAIALARTRVPQLAVLDVLMPKGNGYEVAHAIKEMDASVPVMILTATIDDENTAEQYGVRVDAFLRKPVSGAELRGAVTELLGPRLAAKGDV